VSCLIWCSHSPSSQLNLPWHEELGRVGYNQSSLAHLICLLTSPGEELRVREEKGQDFLLVRCSLGHLRDLSGWHQTLAAWWDTARNPYRISPLQFPTLRSAFWNYLFQFLNAHSMLFLWNLPYIPLGLSTSRIIVSDILDLRLSSSTISFGLGHWFSNKLQHLASAPPGISCFLPRAPHLMSCMLQSAQSLWHMWKLEVQGSPDTSWLMET
jgi:hypothetical protein